MPRGRAKGPGRLWKRGPNWILDYRDADGQRHQRSLGPKKADAERRRAEIIRRRDMEVDGLGGVAGMDMALGELAEEYLMDLQPGVTDRHHRIVASRLRRTVHDLGPTTRVRDIRPIDVRRLIQVKVQEGAANRTANLIGTTVAACLNWAVDAGLIASNPIGKLKKLPETRDHQRCRRRALSDTEIGRFLTASRLDDDVAAANPAYTLSPRIPQTPLWVALLDTGARYGELRQLTWGDVSFKEGLLTLRAESTKSRRARAIPMTAALAQELQGLRVAQQRRRQRLPTASEPVLLSPRGEPWGRYTTNPMRIFVRILDAAEIPRMDAHGEKLDIHALRHSFASRLARNGVALTQAQRLLGHSDPKLTAAVYTHLDAEDLRSAITQIQPAPMPTTGTHERRASE